MGFFGGQNNNDRRLSTKTRRDTVANLNDGASINSDDTNAKREKFFTQIDVQSDPEDENSSDYIELMAGRLWKYCEAKTLFGVSSEFDRSTASLYYRPGEYKTYAKCPILGWDDAIVGLDAQVVIAIDNQMVQTISTKILHTATDINLDATTVLQVFNSLSELRRARLEHTQAFIRDEKLIVVWSDDGQRACELAGQIQEQILEIVWNDDQILRQGDGDLEKQSALHPNKRPIHLTIPFICAVAWALILLLFCLEVRTLLIESLYDHTWMRFAILSYYPLVFFM